MAASNLEKPPCYAAGDVLSKPQPTDEHVEKKLDNANEMLMDLGYTPQLSRNRSTLQVAFMSFVLAAIPCGLATTLSNIHACPP